MTKRWIGAVALFAMFLSLPGSVRAQSAQALPMPGVDAATDFPNEHEMPDPSLVYKIVFDIGKASPKIDDVNPGPDRDRELLQHARQGRRARRSQKVRRRISSEREPSSP